jgi:lipid II:glycine glycyltransferase (peptidoglycan interpeptide bridge formation enzyme)
MLDTKMGTRRPKLSGKPSPSRSKSIRQKRDRRKTSLMKKSFEYSKMCGADVCLGIRIRDTCRVYIFSADASGFWAFIGSKLVYFHHMHTRPKVNCLGLLLSTPSLGY